MEKQLDLIQKETQKLLELIEKIVVKEYENVDVDYEEGEYNYGADRDGNRGITISDRSWLVYHHSELDSPIDFYSDDTFSFDEVTRECVKDYSLSDKETEQLVDNVEMFVIELSKQLFEELQEQLDVRSSTDIEDLMYDLSRDNY